MKKTKNPASQTSRTLIGQQLNFASKEAYNLLRTNILFSFPDHEAGRGKIIGVTSTIPGEGKSTISINLAYSLAEAGYRVILMDGDMRRPSVAKYIGKPTTPGLSNFLTENGKKIIYKNILCENLSMIMAGDTPPNPSELLGSEKMKKLLDIFAADYDFIILDLPPVLSVPDPLVVSKWLDGIIVVVHHDYTNESEVRETIRQLKFGGVRILGFVYNAHTEGGSSYFGGYTRDKYYYNKYYSSKSKEEKDQAGNEG